MTPDTTRWTPAHSPLWLTIVASALALVGLLSRRTPRAVALFPLVVTAYVAWEMCQDDD